MTNSSFSPPQPLANGNGQTGILSFILLTIFPILSLVFWIDFALFQKNHKQNQLALTQIESNLLKLKREAGESTQLQRELNFLYGLANEYEISHDFLQNLPTRLKNANLDFLNYIFFDATGTIICSRIQSDKYVKVWKQIFAALSESDEFGNDKNLFKTRPIFKTMFGNIDTNELLYQKGCLINVNLIGKRGYFYWNTFHKSPTFSSQDKYLGGVIAWFAESPATENFSIKHAIYRLNKEADENEGYALINISNPNTSYGLQTLSKRISISPNLLVQHAMKLSKNFQKYEPNEKFLVMTLPIDKEKVVIGIRKIFNPTKFVLGIYFWTIVFFIIFIFYLHYSKNAHRIINSKFLTLFGTIVPALIVLLFAVEYLEDYTHKLEDNSFQKLFKHIENIDDGFSSVVDSLERLYNKMTKLACFQGADTIHIDKLFKRLQKAELLEEIFIIDISGKVLRFSESKKNSNNVLEKMLPMLAHKIFQNKFQQDTKNIRTKFSDLMFDNMADNISELVFGKTAQKLLAELYEAEDKIINFNLGKTTNLIYTHFSSSKNDIKNAKLIFLLHNSNIFAYRYLKRLVHNNSLQPDSAKQIRLAVYSKDGTGIYPREYAKYPFIIESIQQALSSDKQSKAVGPIGNQNYLAAAAPLKYMPNYILITIYSRESLKSANAKTAIKLTLLLVSIITSIFVAGAYHAGFLDSRSA